MQFSALPIGLVAGVAAALLFAGVVTQSPGAVVLALAAPVPIFIASLGWGSRAGFIAAATSAVAIAAFMGSFLSGITMLLGSALPAAAVGHMAGLARPRNDGAGLDWYPVSRLLFAILCIAAATCVVLGLLMSYDAAGLEAAVTQALLSQPDGTIAAEQEIRSFVQLVVSAIPFVQPIISVLTWIGCLYVAAAITRISGRLPRPKDDVPTVTALPRVALPIFALGLAASFAPGTVGMLGAVLTGAFGMGFTLVGLAAMHRRTRGRPARGLVLFSAYGAIILLFIPLFAFLVLGVFDTARNRMADASNT
ncbi:hypothetical protein [Aureimonas sp. Leaf324]|jgi:lysylphosphatidylglycerol synthetase-like protein (DUF2156 family)|uniref:hypothetical protein n=1 Tax=Aureimonas sp. Leaf324 TaxID=1736336 RepID=UPI0006F3BBFF|nr:hypothetical protein [Aureimonas sp. Leaf324]KQQ91262.1 hypothetical protein ASF65_01705 [Aureimonas sp. Leaf324]